TRSALAAYPNLKKQVAESGDPLRLALKFAMAGNIIDSGMRRDLDVETEIALLSAPGAHEGRVFMDYAAFCSALKKARTVLIVGDNAGETVFDRLLIEEILRLHPDLKFTYAVRAMPALNDALLEDALAAGLGKVAELITSGSDFPGTSLQGSTPEFRQVFDRADVVISKGQGNYESLTGSERDIFFMLMLKCPVVAKHAGLAEGSYVLRRVRGSRPAGRTR
ncbi:MAG: ARMT1-like domain-containing protein, partial [Elusimicrobiaceae bacterium]|nr:ARMT1-like domain-containing protein [Elusimicrobiaceae bacterium]